MKIQVLDRAKKKKFVQGLSGLGIKKIPQMLVRSGKERIRAFTGDLDRKAIMDLWHLLPIEGVGLYVGKDMVNRNGVREVRMSLDGMHVWKEQLTERVVELDEEYEEKWFLGEDVALGNREFFGEFVSVKSKSSGDFIGTGKVSVDGVTLFSFLPKERRRKPRMS